MAEFRSASSEIRGRKRTRKCGTYSDILPLKASRRDSISNLSSLGSKSELPTNLMPLHLEPLWGATLMPHRGCGKIVRVGNNSGRFCFKPFVDQSSRNFPTPSPECVCHVSFCRYSPLSLKVVEKPNKCKSFGPNFSGGKTPTVLRQIVIDRDLPSTIWQSLVECRLLISVCEIWQ